MNLPDNFVWYLFIGYILLMVLSAVMPYLTDPFRRFAELSRDDLDNTIRDLKYGSLFSRPKNYQVAYVVGDKDRNHWMKIGRVKGRIMADNYYILSVRVKGRNKLFVHRKDLLIGDIYAKEYVVRGYGIDSYRKTFLFPTPPKFNEIEKQRQENINFIEAQVSQRGTIYLTTIERWNSTKKASQPVKGVKASVTDWLRPQYGSPSERDPNRVIEEEV